jgi:hypothetical protein
LKTTVGQILISISEEASKIVHLDFIPKKVGLHVEKGTSTILLDNSFKLLSFGFNGKQVNNGETYFTAS